MASDYVVSEHLLLQLICQVMSEGLKLFSPAQTKSFEHWLPSDSVPLCMKQQMSQLTGSLVVPEILYHRCKCSLATQITAEGSACCTSGP